jgi:secreted PhoX family phosphatase
VRKNISIIAAASIAALLSGCGDTESDSLAAAATATNPQETISGTNTVSFASIPTPTADAQKLTLQHSETVTVNSTVNPIDFSVIMATDTADNGEIFGQVKDQNDQPITFADGSPYICNGTNDGVGSGLDFSSILQKNGKLYMVSQFECQIGAMYKFELNQDAVTGALSAKPGTLEFISQKDEFGGFVHCAGQATPWNSHLGSEEYETDARMVGETAGADGKTGDVYYDETAKFFGGDATKMSPYFYGWSPEVKIGADGKAVYAKHYAMGRFSHELSFVMPDKKTVYMSDDGTNVGLFMFKADKEEDLSAGTLYAAKLTQASSENGGSFNVEWIELARLNDATVKAEVAKMSKFSDLFDAVDPVDGVCTEGYASINTSWGHECLKIKAGVSESTAAALETRRYAAMRGATTELRKEEGVSYDPVRKKLYVAMSEIDKGMLDNGTGKYDIGGPNHIKLSKNVCGAVYEFSVNDSMIATDMQAVVLGETIETDANGNKCHLDKISNPDNVTMLPGTDILMIGEDTSSHENNIIWAFNTQTKQLDRVIATSRGAETTSPFWYTNVNGWGYMTAVTQHPDADAAEMGQSTVGVLGPVKFK